MSLTLRILNRNATSVLFRQSAIKLGKNAFVISSPKLVSKISQYSTKPSVEQTNLKTIYEGPLTKTAKYLKVFSISSLVLTCSVAPLIFFIDAGLSTVVRTILFGAALGTSSVSTALIHWCIFPYVTKIQVDPSTLETKEKTNEPIPTQRQEVGQNTKFTFETLSLFGGVKSHQVLTSQLETSSRLFTTHKLKGANGKMFYIHPNSIQEVPELNQLDLHSTGKFEALKAANSTL
ncbi:hypothetical protein CONCODRAFT_80931 [Conidiobolus coronatus NRRL 28638]|uniref:Uncharacterized protein n=1 Tax=Conidiobolus coronatus (strain ATCC 28846 / CBS 209.66 / NRRL 28638) TaxID=796925 RepID=A0A137NPK5_CONC2|nr:hypothetical protein CONCODRAFT_80931 [Conidiobolus coronatus NRRL 28638]|eukprot:KXN64666.1 hypothetical protein CONCODRAFT_80931 [Conidiobolus coronatus NRRL 28638]